MRRVRIRGRWWRVAVAAAAATTLGALLLKPVVERTVRARVEAAALRHGMVVRIGSVHAGLWPLLRLEAFDLDLGHGARLRADRIAAAWPGRLRISVQGATLSGPAGITLKTPDTAWNVSNTSGKELKLAMTKPQPGLTVSRRIDTAGRAWTIEASRLDVGQLDIRRDDNPLLHGGIAQGRVDLQDSAATMRFQVNMELRGARFGGLAHDATQDPRPGAPTDIALNFDGSWLRGSDTLDIPAIHATVAGATLSGSLALRELDADPAVDLNLGVQQLDFGQLLATSGLEVPEALGMKPGTRRDLGTATIGLEVHGRIAEPASLLVTQKIGFKPPVAMPPGIARLRGEFQFSAQDGRGSRRAIQVSPSAPGFIALRDVPPLFLRTLLLAEDASFYGHRGIDLRELPSALLTNWSRGGATRGASTISQQLAKNLFLSRDKQFGRKLQELAITFLLESALGKERILEIYLNIIEWGPDLRGLRPAALHYFAREPGALTPAQIAFLVAIIPGPIKYQSSFSNGSPGPGLRQLIDDLLGKLRSVDAISEEEFQRALRETITVARPLARTL
jgi:monofunctional biosynthetic peptidoglycan transglycosylase